MTTLNAKANNAYHEMVAEYEREHPDEVFSFDHQRDAFEAGWEAGHEAARPTVDREALAGVINEVASATGLAKYFKSGSAADPSDVEEFVAAVMDLLTGKSDG